MGQDGLLALFGYVLTAISPFLPWATVFSAFGQIQMTGFQVQRGEQGFFLLALAVIGALLTLIPKRTMWTGLGLIAVGLGVIYTTKMSMDIITRVAQETTTRYVSSSLSSGGYLAIVSGVILVAAGCGSLYKIEVGKRATKVMQAVARPTSGLHGSFPLKDDIINEKVGHGSPGVYALGYRRGETFIIQHVGRSDTDVHARLKEYIGKYDRFKFDTLESPTAAFAKECELYHDFDGPSGKIAHNKTHPERSEGATWNCPRCAIFSSTKPQSVAKTGKRFCGQCGAELVADVRFCMNCGKEAASYEP